ncbi:MAG: pilus assembly protein PilP [Burkholderiaceae bacterium]
MTRFLWALPLLAALTGCGEDHGELINWMNEVRATVKPVTEKIAEPKRFAPFRYENSNTVDPFSTEKLALAIEKFQQLAREGLKPDLNRRREVLEAYPLDMIRMVGHLSNGRLDYALLEVDRVVYQARVGNYAGQNFGKITRISETEVMLKELVQDAAGDWVERESALRLQEGGEKK